MYRTKSMGVIALAASGLLALSACSSGSPSQSSTGEESTGGASSVADDSILDGTDLDALIAAAQAEGEVVVYWASSRVQAAGDAFEEEYGIKVTSTKMADTEITERVIREVDSENVLVDMIGYEDGARIYYDLIPNGYAETFIPPAVEDKLMDDLKDPLVYLVLATAWGYNSETYPDGCPVENLWQLTEPEWKHNIHMLDPKLRSTQILWFSALEKHSDELDAAYEDFYGEPLELTEDNAGLEFIKRLAENEPILHAGDEEIAVAVGTKGQDNPPMGQYSLTRHRDNEELDHALEYCDLTPFPAYSNLGYAAMIKGSPHPNAARLFLHYLMAEDGVSAWTQNVGGYSAVPGAPSNPDNPYASVEEWGHKMLNLSDVETFTDRRGALTDFWTQVNG